MAVATPSPRSSHGDSNLHDRDSEFMEASTSGRTASDANPSTGVVLFRSRLEVRSKNILD